MLPFPLMHFCSLTRRSATRMKFAAAKLLTLVCLSVNAIVAKETAIPSALDGTNPTDDQPIYDEVQQQLHDFDIVTYARQKLAQLSLVESENSEATKSTDNGVVKRDLAVASDMAEITNRPPKNSFSMIESKVANGGEVEHDLPIEQEENEKEFDRFKHLTSFVENKQKRKNTRELTEPGQKQFNGKEDSPPSAYLDRTTSKAEHSQPFQEEDEIEFTTTSPIDSWKDTMNAFLSNQMPAEPLGAPQVIRTANIHYERVPEQKQQQTTTGKRAKLQQPEIAQQDWRPFYPIRNTDEVNLSPDIESHYQSGQPSVIETNRANYAQIKSGSSRNGLTTGPHLSFNRPSSTSLISAPEPTTIDDRPFQYRVINHYTSIQYPMQMNEPSPPSRPAKVAAEAKVFAPNSATFRGVHPSLAATSTTTSDNYQHNHVPANNHHHQRQHYHHQNNRQPLDRPRAEMIGGDSVGEKRVSSRVTTNLAPSSFSLPPALSEISRLNQMNPVTRATTSTEGQHRAQGRQINNRHKWWQNRPLSHPNRPHYQPTSSLFGLPPSVWPPSSPPFLISTPFVDNAGYTHFPIFQAEASVFDPSTYDFDVEGTSTFGGVRGVDLSMSGSGMAQFIYPPHSYSTYPSFLYPTIEPVWW